MVSRADLHSHTIYSGVGSLGALRFPESTNTPEEMVDHARFCGLRVLCVTDHDSIKGALIAKEYAKKFDDIEVVIGEEITTSEGEIIGLWLTEFVPPKLTLNETIELIRRQNGVVIAPHPFSFHVRAIGDRVITADIDGIEVLNGGHVDRYSNKMANEAASKYEGLWAKISSSDAHSKSTMGYAWTEFEGETAEDLHKAILEKKTVPCGRPVPVDKAIFWSMSVVINASKMILHSLFKEPKDRDDPIAQKITSINSMKKLAALMGAGIYLFPPVPFIASVLSNTWLDRKARVLLKEISKRLDEL